jgi:homoserine dehydrogenase
MPSSYEEGFLFTIYRYIDDSKIWIGGENMTAINVALLGYGTVGKGVYMTIKNHQSRFEALLGKKVKIVAVLVKNIEKHSLADKECLLTNNFEDIISLPKLDVVIDAIVGCEPGYTYLQAAIRRGCHVITANKEMFAHYGKQLQSLADKHQVSIGFEATVAGGVPVIQTLKKLLNVNRITKVEGIVNGTSNFILTKMREEGLTFSEALTVAQDLGYAELDPTNDVEGYDAFYKAMVLSQVIFGDQPEWNAVVRKGITDISTEKIKLFSGLGLRFKHVATLEKTAGNRVKCSVKPVLVTQSHPLYQVEGVQNAVSIDADIVGNISIQGPGAGMFPTASAIVEDLIHLGKPKIVKRCVASFDHDDSADVLSNWVLTGERIVDVTLPSSIDYLGFLDSNVLLVSGTEEDIHLFVDSIPGIECFQVYGQVTDLEITTVIRVSENQKLS